ncbi:MAG: hypothetical protein OXN16_12605 [Gammaproteobacteria bacterium]|nr:hypothetical protein [Gammaproteobacteria bacterium]
MSLHAELLKQALHLARKEPKKPTQASLRRSISVAYYALFHHLVDEATKFMLSGSRQNMRDCLARAFSHSNMKQTSKAFSQGTIPTRLNYGFSQGRIAQPLINVADAFVQLQEARHDADYNRAYRVTRREAVDLAELTARAFQDWRQVRGSTEAEVFLIGLLAYQQIHA